MKKIDKLVLKYKSKLALAQNNKLPAEMKNPLMEVYQKLHRAQQEAVKGNSAEVIATNIVESVDKLKSYSYPLKNKAMLMESLTKASLWASAPLDSKKRGSIAGTLGYWKKSVRAAALAEGNNILKYFSEYPGKPASVSKLKPAGKTTTSTQPGDIQMILYKSGILGWQSGFDPVSMAGDPPMNTRSNTANRIFKMLDAAGSDGISDATIAVDKNGNANVNAKVHGGNQNAVLTQMRRYFNPKITSILQKAKVKPPGSITVKWLARLRY